LTFMNMISASTSITHTGLQPATAYTYYVRAMDAAGNLSANSNTISATTLSPVVNECDTFIVILPSSVTASWSGSRIINTWNGKAEFFDVYVQIFKKDRGVTSIVDTKIIGTTSANNFTYTPPTKSALQSQYGSGQYSLRFYVKVKGKCTTGQEPISSISNSVSVK